MRLNKKTPVYLSLLIGLLVGCIYIAIVLYRLYINADITWFIHAGDEFTSRDELYESIYTHKNVSGYDGQFYYRFSQNPLTHLKVENGIEIDSPIYRGQRIVYPLIVRILSLGNNRVIPWIMVSVNIVGMAVIGYTSTLYAQRINRSVWWGILLGLYPGFMYTFLYNLTEIIAVLFVMFSMYMLRIKRFNWGVVGFCLSVLSRETTIIFPIGYGLYMYFASKEKGVQRNWVLIGLPIAVYMSWRTVLFALWGNSAESPIDTLLTNITFPLAGIVSAVHIWKVEWIFMTMISIVICYTIYCMAVLKFNRYTLIWTLYTALFISLSVNVVGYINSFTRASVELFVISVLMWMEVKSPLQWVVIGMLAFFDVIIWSQAMNLLLQY